MQFSDAVKLFMTPAEARSLPLEIKAVLAEAYAKRVEASPNPVDHEEIRRQIDKQFPALVDLQRAVEAWIDAED